MINHITLYVSDLEKSKEFYVHLLGTLGYQLLTDGDITVGFCTLGNEKSKDFWLKKGREKGKWIHDLSCLAFSASNKEEVNAFYQAGIKAGGKDNGAPGYHVEYGPGYYAAFVFDLDGNNIEAVFDDPNPMI